jgi:hypothetical protein
MAMSPVAAAELLLVQAGDGAHLRPGCGIGWAGEDHAVVEEDCLNWSHARFDFTAELSLAGAIAWWDEAEIFGADGLGCGGE